MALGEEVSAEDRGWVEEALSRFARTYNIEPLSTEGSALFTTGEAANEVAMASLQLHLKTL
jgi:hypothetical protein